MLGRLYRSGQWPDFLDDSIYAYSTGNSNEDGDSWVEITQQADDESTCRANNDCSFDRSFLDAAHGVNAVMPHILIVQS